MKIKKLTADQKHDSTVGIAVCNGVENRSTAFLALQAQHGRPPLVVIYDGTDFEYLTTDEAHPEVVAVAEKNHMFGSDACLMLAEQHRKHLQGSNVFCAAYGIEF